MWVLQFVVYMPIVVCDNGGWCVYMGRAVVVVCVYLMGSVGLASVQAGH